VVESVKTIHSQLTIADSAGEVTLIDTPDSSHIVIQRPPSPPLLLLFFSSYFASADNEDSRWSYASPLALSFCDISFVSFLAQPN
jgi:hypothetical protein